MPFLRALAQSEMQTTSSRVWTKAKETSLPYHLPVTGGKHGFMPFLRTLVRSETQTASSIIWTRIAESISYDDNRYAKRASIDTYFYNISPHL